MLNSVIWTVVTGTYRSLGFDDSTIGPEAECCDDLLRERSWIGRSLSGIHWYERLLHTGH